MDSLSTEIDAYVHQSSTAAGPNIHHARADATNEGGTNIMVTEEIIEEEEGEKVDALMQQTPPTRVQSPRQAKTQPSP